MRSEGDLGISAQTIVELPIETLALAVLENYDSTNAWNRHNWLLAAERTLGRGPYLQALAEAWSWLEARTLVTHTPNNSSSEARSVTRAGKQAIAAGSIKEILAAERIALDLHPRLHGRIRPIFL